MNAHDFSKGIQNVLKSIHIGLLTLVAAGSPLVTGCGSTDGSRRTGSIEKIEIHGAESAKTKWSDVFKKTGEIRLKFTKPGYESFIPGVIYSAEKDSFIILDFKTLSLHQFDKNGVHMRPVGKNGPGPGEYLRAVSSAYDDADGFYIFDVGKFRLLKYRTPDFTPETEIITGDMLQHFLLTPEKEIIAYLGGTAKGHLLERLNSAGKAVGGAFPIADERFHMFQSRFWTGNMLKISPSEFIVTYPKEYAFYFYNMRLEPTRIMRAKTFSRFIPGPLDLPANLARTDYTPAQAAEWWGSTLHSARMFLLDKGIIGVGMLKYSKNGNKDYLNIHNFLGETLALGLEFPNDGQISCSDGDTLYVLESEKTSETDENAEPFIVKYEFIK